MISVPQEAAVAAQPEDDSLVEAREALARRLGSVVNTLAERDDVLLDMVWGRDDTPAPAWFDPQLVQVTVNGSVALDADTHPDDVDPLTVSGRLRHPVLVGMTCHEAGHARSTRWSGWEAAAGRAAVRAAELLEEPRIEARHLQERPEDLVFLRACAQHIVLPPATGPAHADRWRAAASAALILGRVDAGVLSRREAEPVRAAAEKILGPKDLASLRTLWRRALKLADGDQAGLLRVARRWVEVVGVDEDDELPGAGCAGGDPGPASPGAPGDDADASDGHEDALGAAVAAVVKPVSVAAQIQTGALVDPEETRRNEEAAARAQQRKRAEESARRTAQDAARRVFAPAPSSVQAPPSSPVCGRRAPSAEERVAARRLGAALLGAQFREPDRIRVASAVPPGRLSGRDAMLAVAQRSRKMPVTARPFRTKVRQRTEEPAVAVGVAVDVSGSMGQYTSILASASWIFAHGTHEVSGTAATVAFGSAVTPIVSPGQRPTQVTEFTANDGTHRFTEAVNALDGALHLARPVGARVLAIVSDGHWEPVELRGGQRLVQRLRRAGVHVLWFCLDPRSKVLPGAHRVAVGDVADIPSALSSALVAALRNA
ncbi:VWA domain-containing protein [Streptomyces sp. NPDC001795]|uniref:VWA domain-containing protein n=1 Tax=Streptomyces sp. NPDC001795 TaxID=3154525 RepID=UPI00332347B1